MANGIVDGNLGIRYQIVTSDQYEECVTFFYARILGCGPLTQSRGCCTRPGYHVAEMDKLVLGVLKSGLSWCAIDEVTNHIIGLRLCCGEFIDDLPEIHQLLSNILIKGFRKTLHLSWFFWILCLITKQ